MNRDEALVAMKEKHRMQLQSTFSCIEMFMENRVQCGVGSDKTFIDWLAVKLAEDKRKAERLFREYERQFPD